MKKLIISGLLSVLVIAATHAQYRTERTGYEGDYFSLEGALDLFRQSYSLLEFERKLNTEENWVNNLDLNYDGRIDYIRVEHRRQGNFHAIILQALVDRYDVQDVAVIEIEMIGYRDAILQIVGDEDLYGEEVVVEPVEGYSDSRRGYHSDYGDYVNVYYWNSVQDILRPQYRVYISPYRWQYYPAWWSPWVQCSWSVYRPRIVIYVNHYHVAPRHRVIQVHHFYRPYRSYSHTVVQRTNQVRVEHGRAPIYRPAPSGRAGDDPSRRNVQERPAATDRTYAPRQRTPVSEEQTPTPADQRATRSATTRPSTPPRSTTQPRSPAPSVQPRTERSASPSVRTPSRDQMTRPSTTTRSSTAPRPTTPAERPAPSVQPRTERSASPSVRTPSRSQATRPSPAPRSTVQPRSPGRTTPASPQKASRSTSSKESGSKSSSRSKEGG